MSWSPIVNVATITYDPRATLELIDLIEARVDALLFAYLDDSNPQRAFDFVYGRWEVYLHDDRDEMTVRTEAGWALLPTLTHTAFDPQRWATRGVGQRDAILRRPIPSDQIRVDRTLGRHILACLHHGSLALQDAMITLLRSKMSHEEWETTQFLSGLSGSLDLPDRFFDESGDAGRFPV